MSTKQWSDVHLELHPDRQLIGKTARFNLANEEFKIPAYVHQQEEYIAVAKNNSFKLEQIKHKMILMVSKILLDL